MDQVSSQSSQMPQHNESPRVTFLPIILIASIMVLIGIVGGYLLLSRNKNESTNKGNETTVAAPSVVQEEPSAFPTVEVLQDTTTWKTYTNTGAGFTIKYPDQGLVACFPDDQKALLLWPAPFDCPIGHDAQYEIGVTIYNQGEYSPYKDPTSSESIIIDGIAALVNTYIYTQEDGPLASVGGSKEVLIFHNNKQIQLTFLGTDQEKQMRFNTMISTLKFTE